jgi:hypothetical protein
MLKKIYIKNGIIFISNKNNMEINYNIVKEYSKENINKDKIIKKYYEKQGMTY